MQSLVDEIAKNRKSHLDNIENMTLKDIKTIERKSYVPRRKTRDELHQEAKGAVKESFKGSGPGGQFFSKAPIMKPKLLDPWTLGRVQAPEKASTKFFFSDQEPFTYTSSRGDEFGASTDETLSKR